jgi:hypothetical protein
MPDSRVAVDVGVPLLEPSHAQGDVVAVYVIDDKIDCIRALDPGTIVHAHHSSHDHGRMDWFAIDSGNWRMLPSCPPPPPSGLC